MFSRCVEGTWRGRFAVSVAKRQTRDMIIGERRAASTFVCKAGCFWAACVNTGYLVSEDVEDVMAQRERAAW